MKKIICLFFLIRMIAFPVFAEGMTARDTSHISDTAGRIRLPRLVSDGMVLQRDTRTRIWGWASPGQRITVRLDKDTRGTRTGADGKWSVMLPPRPAGGPYTMEIGSDNNPVADHITIRDILFGDVWVCSGQSNMELPMERVKIKYPDVIAHADNPLIRQFSVDTRYHFTGPLDDLSSGRWEAADPKTVLRFSAVGYFFARALFDKYHVPVGLIKNSVGGSPAEAWLSEGALKAFPSYLATAQQYKDSLFLDSIARNDRARDRQWYQSLWQRDKGLHEAKPWYDPDYDDSGWSVMHVPGYWADQVLPPVNGVVWFRKSVEVPAAMTDLPAVLSLGRIVDRDSVYVNGRFVGTIGYQYPPRRYELPAGVLKPGKNIIVIRVINSAGRGGFVPDKPYQLTAAGQTIDLSGPWRCSLGATADPLEGPTFFQYKPEGLFNAMLAPLLPYPIKGVIWYQGESNTDKPEEYFRLFSSVITDWRRHWGQGNFPFLYVQLANFLETKDQPSESDWAALREAQRETLAVPGTAMAVTTDIGEWNDIHPLDKEDVGKRLALAAEKVAYGDDTVVSSGPLYHSMEVKGDSIILHFTSTGGGLVAKGDGVLKYFAIAGADKKFAWAKARIAGDAVIVRSEQVAHPVAVRYAWADNPEGANLYNTEGLPASTFTTEQPSNAH